MSTDASARRLSDIREALEDARGAMERAAISDPYRELMATYVALGEVLESDLNAESAEDCHDLARRLVKLGEWVGRASDQRWAVWVSSTTSLGGEG